MTDADDRADAGPPAGTAGPGALSLVRGAHRLDLLPDLGGAVAGWTVGPRALLHPTSDANLPAQRGRAVAAYPLVPFSNRIGGGRFAFDGTEHVLAPNIVGEDNAIHGNGWERVWIVAHRDVDRAVLILDHHPHAAGGPDPDSQWPFTYRAVLSYALVENGLDVEIAIENRDSRPQPVGFGFHPFFPRDAETTISFGARGVWLPDGHGLPEAHVPATGEWSFTQPTAIEGRSIDHCFSGFSGHARIDWSQDAPGMAIDADPVFRHAVVYTGPDKPFVALEPVTNMNDAIHHPEIPDRGLHVLAPMGRLQGKIRFRLIGVDG